MVSLSDVARSAHVSKMTVSRVINHPEQVSLEIRTEVQQVINQLGYVQNRTGRALANHRHYNIAFILLDNVDEIEPYYAHLLIHLTDVLQAYGYTLEIRHEHNFDVTNVDGFLISGVRHSDYNALRNLSIPVVIYGSEPGITAVDIDNTIGTQLATELLLKQSYQQILFLGMDVDEAFEKNRENGYRQAMQTAKKPIQIYKLANDEHVSREFLIGLSLMPKTGIVAATDRLALGALRACIYQGLSVPHDVGIVGFDGIYVHQLAEQSLTTVKQPLKAIAQQMVHLLLDELSGKTVQSVYIVPELLIGETTK